MKGLRCASREVHKDLPDLEQVKGAPKVPTISRFYGILIRMFYADHAPPHFHAQYGDSQAIVDIRRLEILEG